MVLVLFSPLNPKYFVILYAYYDFKKCFKILYIHLFKGNMYKSIMDISVFSKKKLNNML